MTKKKQHRTELLLADSISNSSISLVLVGTLGVMVEQSDALVAVDGPVTMPPIDHVPWPLGQGEIPLTAWLALMTCSLRVCGSKHAWALCAVPHTEGLFWLDMFQPRALPALARL